jgi:CDP-glucose 4,6-dehydratase
VSLRDLLKFYSKKSVFITGHTGFVGSWMTLLLSRIGTDITGYSLRPPSNPYLYSMLKFDGNLKSIRADIKSLPKLNKAIRDSDPDIIIHLAAQPILLDSYKKPRETYLTNVIGTVNVFEAALNSRAKSIINITSDKCYENNSKMMAYKENDRLGGFDPYSSSKAAAELVTSAYRNSFFNQVGMGLASARAGNIIGGGDWGSMRLVPEVVNSLRLKNDILLRNPDAIRPWQYVLDAAYGYLLLGQKVYIDRAKYSSAWNFGPPQNSIRTVSYIVTKFRDSWRSDVKVKTKVKKVHLHEENMLILDSSKSRKKLGWKTYTDLDKSIAITADWYKRYYSGSDMDGYSKALLQDYLS